MSLRQIFKKEFNKVVDKQVDIAFDLDRDAFYLVKVTARARAWWQRLPPMSKDHWADEELKVVVDSTPLNLKFNGNNLWGTRQFIFLLQHLSAGSHIISLINKHKPFLEVVEVCQVEDFSGIDLLSVTEQKPEDTFLNTFISRSKPWITVHSQGSAITGIQIEAKAEKSPLPLVTDDEDLQIRINGERQLNKEEKSHKYWYWCGRTLKGRSKTFEKSFAREDKVNLLELISDRSPSVSRFLISFRRIPTVGDPEWTGDFADDSEVMILTRAIYGEVGGETEEAKIAVGWAIRNRVEDSQSRWGQTYHNVILAEDQYDSFWNPRTFNKVRNPPVADPAEKEVWEESYNSAGSIIGGKVTDPTNGANHFYATTISKPDWATDDKFTIQIGITRFYKL